MGLIFSESGCAVLDASSIDDIDFTNDGSLLAVAFVSAGTGSGIAVMDARARAVPRLVPASRMGRGVAFAAGQRLYSLADSAGGDDVQLCRSDLDGGDQHVMARYTRHPNVRSLIRDQACRHVAVLGNFLEVWDVESGKVVRFREAKTPETVVRGAFSYDGNRLYVAGLTPGRIELFDIASDRFSTGWPAPGSYDVAHLAISSGEEYLVAVSEGMYGVSVIDLKTNQEAFPSLYNARTFTNRYVFVQASAFLAAPEETFEAADMASGSVVLGPPVAPGPATASASAWESPIVAFALQNQLCWARFSRT